jgi:hypothetical protein
MEAIAAADKIAHDLVRLAVVLEANTRRLTVQTVDAGVTRFEQNLSAGMQALVDEISHYLVLRVDRDGAAASEFVHVDAVALLVKAKLYTVMNQPFAAQALAHPRRVEQIYCALFEHAGAVTLFHVLARLRLDYDGLDAVKLEQVREE